MINRKTLREKLTDEDIIHLMKLLGSEEFINKEKYIQFKTICHNIHASEAGFNLSYYKDSHRFLCFSSCGSMDIFDVIKHRWELLKLDTDTHFDNIAYWVMNHTGVDDDIGEAYDFVSPIDPKDYNIKTKEIILPEKSPIVLEAFSNFKCPEWLNDGISAEAMEKYNIKYSIPMNAVIIPHYDVHGRLIGIRRRALSPEEAAEAKYKPIYVEGQSYSHPLGYNLYGLDKVIEEVKIQKRIIIAEGEKAALQGYTLWGDRNVVVSACGNKINKWQIHLIMKYCHPNEIIIAFDKGLDLENIKKMCEKYSCYCNFSYLYDYSGRLLKDKESPLDRPDSIEKLIKGRYKVR